MNKYIVHYVVSNKWVSYFFPKGHIPLTDIK